VIEGSVAPKGALPCEDWDHLFDKNLMMHAYAEVKRKIQKRGDAKTIEGFELFMFQKLSAAEVSNVLNTKFGEKISTNQIYQDKHRVIESWKLEVKKLKLELGE